MRTDFRSISVVRGLPVTWGQVQDTDPVVGLANGISKGIFTWIVGFSFHFVITNEALKSLCKFY